MYIFAKVRLCSLMDTAKDSLHVSYNRQQVIEAIRNTVSKSPHTRAILFGSRARNDAHDNSDWDVLLLVDKEKITKEDYDNISYPLFELGWMLQQQINPVLYTEKEWQKHHFTPFFKNVSKDGIAL